MSLKPPGEPRTPLVVNFEIKSAQLPLVALFLKDSDTVQLAQALQTQFGSASESPDFFENEPLLFDFSALDPNQQCPDLHVLQAAAKACGLVPVAFRAAPSTWQPLLVAQGWVEAAVELPSRVLHLSSAPAITQTPPEPVLQEVRTGATLVIDKPLRSGQKVYARGADLVVLAMVNQGAEVVADGNIHVYAPLRGKAMAGARGNTQARIFSLCLEPELISIAGVYRTSENPLPKDIAGRAAQVRLSSDGQDKLIIEALKT
jgi:septum site-determining protein MinC